jgi:hypothetical protein
VLPQQAAEHRPERQAERDRRGEDADGLGPVVIVAERRRDHRQGQREHDPGAQPHQRSRRDQLCGRDRQRAPQRRRQEHRQPGQQQPLAAEAVPDHPGGQHDRGEDELVGAKPSAFPQVGHPAARTGSPPLLALR